jgi:hypothetical protein
VSRYCERSAEGEDREREARRGSESCVAPVKPVGLGVVDDQGRRRAGGYAVTRGKFVGDSNPLGLDRATGVIRGVV